MTTSDDINELKVYIETLEKENALLRERNDKLYELNCRQSIMLSNTLGDITGRYSSMVRHDHFNSAKNVYNQVMCVGTANTVPPLMISYI